MAIAGLAGTSILLLVPIAGLSNGTIGMLSLFLGGIGILVLELSAKAQIRPSTIKRASVVLQLFLRTQSRPWTSRSATRAAATPRPCAQSAAAVAARRRTGPGATPSRFVLPVPSSSSSPTADSTAWAPRRPARWCTATVWLDPAVLAGWRRWSGSMKAFPEMGNSPPPRSRRAGWTERLGRGG